MELVTEVRPPKSVNPNMSIIYGVPKSAKTTICSMLPNHLILELENGGANYITGRIQEINKASEFNEVLAKIRDSETKVCDFLIVDSGSKMDDWSEIVGTYNYMNKSQGKKFNREGEIPTGVKILHTDPRFETVHSLGEGYGYQHSRQVMIDWYDKLAELITLGKVMYIIILAHVKDKSIESKNGDTVEHLEINLTGKVKSIYSSRVDAVGHLKRVNNKCYLNFAGDEKVISGGRCSHLNGEILISEKLPDGTIKAYWDKIYLK
jgi:hypothetical protein